MLKKLREQSGLTKGKAVFIVTREGNILEGFAIQNILMDLVSLNSSPLAGSEKQGFTIQGDLLLPNWCEGKRKIEAACLTREKAVQLAEKVKQEIAQGMQKPRQVCSSGNKKVN